MLNFFSILFFFQYFYPFILMLNFFYILFFFHLLHLFILMLNFFFILFFLHLLHFFYLVYRLDPYYISIFIYLNDKNNIIKLYDKKKFHIFIYAIILWQVKIFLMLNIRHFCSSWKQLTVSRFDFYIEIKFPI